MIVRKLCPACGKRLSAAAFNSAARSADGLARTCRACTNTRRRERDRARDRCSEPVSSSAKFWAALRTGNVPALQKLIASGVPPQWSWICETMRGGHLAVAERLLEAGVARNVFTMAAMGETSRLIRRLGRIPTDARLAVNIEPASRQVTPLHVASAADWRTHGADRLAAQVEIASALCERGAEFEARACYRGIDEATPLFCACWSSGNLALVRWFLDRGAVPADAYLLAALGHFQRHGQPAFDVAAALLAWGLPVDGKEIGDRTPLQAFAHQGAHRTVAWLIAHGADVNARGPEGRTAAHFAAERNTGPATLAVLAEHGADLQIRDADGNSPLDLAELHGKTRVAAWIRNRIFATGR